MTQPDTNQSQSSPSAPNPQWMKTVEGLEEFSLNLLDSMILLRWIGYGLLVFALFDLIVIFIPLNLMNRLWEFEAMGQLVERVPFSLIGLALVFYGKENYRYKWEIFILKILSGLTLFVGLLYFLLIPWSVANTLQIDRQYQAEITTQVDQRLQQIQQVNDAIAKTTTKEQIAQLLGRLDREGRIPNLKDSQQLTEVKKKVSEYIAQGESKMKAEAQATLNVQRLELLKNSVKWNLGALVSGALFIFIWRNTRWARRRW